jgi:putative ABC transport system permease protein
MIFRSSWRFFLRHPWQMLLCILGVALGVAVVTAIDLANHSARRAFTLAGESVAGRATHQIVGGPSGVDETLFRDIVLNAPQLAVAPLVDGYVSVGEFDNATFQLLGVDPFFEAPFRNLLGADRDGAAAGDRLGALLVEPGSVLLGSEVAARYGVAAGDRLTLQIGPLTRSVRVLALLSPADDLDRSALNGLLITDIASAQELLERNGTLSRIDLIADEAELAGVRALLPAGVELNSAAGRSSTLQQMTAAFELNLTALSLLALIVGVFLIYNTMTFSVVQRRGLFGTLRCLGVTRGEIGRLILAEAGLIGLIGGILGLLLGIALANLLVGMVTQTINDLYFVVTVSETALEPALLLKGLLLGLTATVAAAAVPAWEALATQPRSTLRRSLIEERIRRLVGPIAVAGLLLAGGGGLLLLIPAGADTSGIVLAFTALFAMVIGSAATVPWLLVQLMRLISVLVGRSGSLLLQMAPRDVIGSLSRSAVAVAALSVAVAVTSGVGIMIGSFRETVVSWLEQSLVADLYISAPGIAANRPDAVIDARLPALLAGLDGVAAVTTIRSVQVAVAGIPTTLVAVNGELEQGRRALRFAAGGDAATWRSWERGGILISEPLAYRQQLQVGDQLMLPTDRGEQPFEIAGIYYDYASDRGVMRVTDDVYRRYWDDRAVSSVALTAAAGTAAADLQARVRAATAPFGSYNVVQSGELRRATLVVFDRTFAVTGVLQLLATIVAFIGVLSALLALQLDRARELATLRAIGLSPGQVQRNVLLQSSLLGSAAGLFAAPLGLLMALLLVYVINRRSFGWTLALTIDPLLFGQALITAIVAAALAALYPAWRMSRTSPAAALREE